MLLEKDQKLASCYGPEYSASGFLAAIAGVRVPRAKVGTGLCHFRAPFRRKDRAVFREIPIAFGTGDERSPDKGDGRKSAASPECGRGLAGKRSASRAQHTHRAS